VHKALQYYAQHRDEMFAAGLPEPALSEAAGGEPGEAREKMQ